MDLFEMMGLGYEIKCAYCHTYMHHGKLVPQGELYHAECKAKKEKAWALKDGKPVGIYGVAGIPDGTRRKDLTEEQKAIMTHIYHVRRKEREKGKPYEVYVAERETRIERNKRELKKTREKNAKIRAKRNAQYEAEKNKVCQCCGKPFVLAKHDWKPGINRLFCSNKCKYATRKFREERECVVCGKKFEVVGIQQKGKKTCSKKCAYTLREKNKRHCV